MINFTRVFAGAALAALTAATLVACGGGDDAAPAATAAVSATGGVGCTDKVAAFFLKNKGSFASAADIYTPGPLGAAAKVAGIADKASATVVVSENCTVTVGTAMLTYVDNSYATSPDGQIDVDMTAAGFKPSHFEVFGKGGANTNVYDETTKAYANFMTK